ncbi:hypothetical protein HHK36_030435 [Tetracentron sinense]|uniref:Uncharacterized protein n=1 Tax=Tetracentron sinense TaxID=13715 RepID=A0A835CY99_TETSI|nr:hypothetical protein HHK36_030435 [Tetracentron sinense]
MMLGEMETTKLAKTAIVLAKDNYEIWKDSLRSYLLEEELWDIVNGTESEPNATEAELKTWQMKNAKALHAIRISCCPQIVSQINEIDSAKAVWDHLASTHQPPSAEGILPSLSTGQGIRNNDYTGSLPLFKAVYLGDWVKAKKFIDLHPGVQNEIISSSGETALHIAAISGHVRIVEELVKLMTEKSLELRNEVGATALHLAALSGITKMAEVMVRKNEKLLGIRSNTNIIPVVLASSCGHKHMVRYLYSVTPTEELNPETSTNGVSLLTSAIVADIYGRHICFPFLIISKHSKNSSLILSYYCFIHRCCFGTSTTLPTIGYYCGLQWGLCFVCVGSKILCTTKWKWARILATMDLLMLVPPNSATLSLN